MVHVVYEVGQLIFRLARERPHLLCVLVVKCQVREVFLEFFLDRLQTRPEFAQALPHVLQVDWMLYVRTWVSNGEI